MSGRSILTFDSKAGDSIVDIATENKLKGVVVVDDTMAGFQVGYEKLKEVGVKFVFGLRLDIANDLDNQETEAKYVIFANNEGGKNALIKISTEANTVGSRKTREGKVISRVTFDYLKTVWNDNDLSLTVPFYDSFVFNNLLRGFKHIPDQEFLKQSSFFVEKNGLPFDKILTDNLETFDNEKILAKSIFYKDKADFKAWQTFKCVAQRTSLEKPNLNHCTSNEFCWESYLEEMKNKNA